MEQQMQKKTQSEEQHSCEVHGADYDALINATQEDAMQSIVNSLAFTGLQATQVGRARNLLQKILNERAANDKVFLAYTSNLISSGLRDLFAELARNKLVDAIISTAGGIEEDVIKCLGESVIGSFDLDGRELRLRGLNRIGNVLVPNNNYCKFEDYFTPILASMHAAQVASCWSVQTTPSELIFEMGKKLGTYCPDTCEQSVLYWCYVHNIPVFSPAITDGSIGDMIYFYNFSKKGMIIDPVADVIRLRALSAHIKSDSNATTISSCDNNNTVPLVKNECAPFDKGEDNSTNDFVVAGAGGATEIDTSHSLRGKNSAIILGGGLPRYHLLSNVKIDRVVCVGTGNYVDGCVSSLCTQDDVSAQLLHPSAEIVKVYGDAAYIFPLLMVK